MPLIIKSGFWYFNFITKARTSKSSTENEQFSYKEENLQSLLSKLNVFISGAKAIYDSEQTLLLMETSFRPFPII